jgi:hypothetical protein
MFDVAPGFPIAREARVGNDSRERIERDNTFEFDRMFQSHSRRTAGPDRESKVPTTMF